MLVKSPSAILVVLLVLTSKLCSSKDEGRKGASNVLEGKIVGGTPVPIEKFPFAVVLYNFGGMCAATILNSWAVMTAAHCFIYNDDVDEMSIQVGATYTYDLNAKLHRVVNVQVHPKYGKEMMFSCDIALVFLESAITFGPKAKKAILAKNDQWMSENETHFMVTGWGWTKYKGETSDQGLLMAELRFITRKRCSIWHSIDLTEDMFCLYGDTERDACKGDSGGGVLWNGQIVGIVSHGDRCAAKNKPSVYTNVWYFRPWIQTTMNKFIEKYCYK